MSSSALISQMAADCRFGLPRELAASRSNSGFFSEKTNIAVSDGENPCCARADERSSSISRAPSPGRALDVGVAGPGGVAEQRRKPARLIRDLLPADAIGSESGRVDLPVDPRCRMPASSACRTSFSGLAPSEAISVRSSFAVGYPDEAAKAPGAPELYRAAERRPHNVRAACGATARPSAGWRTRVAASSARSASVGFGAGRDHDRDVARCADAARSSASSSCPSMAGMTRSSRMTSGARSDARADVRRPRRRFDHFESPARGRHCRTRYRADSSSSIDEHADRPARARVQAVERVDQRCARSTGFDKIRIGAERERLFSWLRRADDDDRDMARALVALQTGSGSPTPPPPSTRSRMIAAGATLLQGVVGFGTV